MALLQGTCTGYFQRAPKLLMPFLIVSDDAIRRSAMVALEYTAPNEGIVNIMKTRVYEDEKSISFAIDCIGTYDIQEDIGFLISFLDHTSYRVRASSVASIGKVGKNFTDESMPPLLNDSNDLIRRVTCGYVGKYGSFQHISALEQLLIDSDIRVREMASQAIFLIEHRALSQRLLHQFLRYK